MFDLSGMTALVTGEALLIAGLGSALGIVITIPASHIYGALVAAKLGNFFQHLTLYTSTLLLSASVTLCIAVCAAAFPSMIILRDKIVEGLRNTG